MLQAALAEGGVVPSNRARYSSAQMVSAIKAGIGSEPLVHCSGGKLTEVRGFRVWGLGYTAGALQRRQAHRGAGV